MPANDQDRAQVAQEMTGETVEIASVDQG